MKDKIKEIYNYWEENANRYGASHWVSWGDLSMIKLERETIAGYLNMGDKVLDAGCANGYSTFYYLTKKPSLIKGFDYSPTMVKMADKRLTASKQKIPVIFYRADIRNIPERSGYFDVSITTRVLINLPSWSLQKKAIDEICRVTKRGGLILFSEAFKGSLGRLNRLRRFFNLPKLTIPAFNKYLDEDLLADYLNKKGLKYQVVNFSSMYYIGSRVIREIYLDKKEKPSFKHFINDFFLELERRRDKLDFGIQKLFVVKKSR